MTCHFNFNTVDAIRALKCARKFMAYAEYFGCTSEERDSLSLLLQQMEMNYYNFLHRNDPSSSVPSGITRGGVAVRAEARDKDSDESLSASLRSLGSRLLELAEAAAANEVCSKF